MESADNAVHREPWNKGKIVGQKAPFKLKDIWALRVRLQMEPELLANARTAARSTLRLDALIRQSPPPIVRAGRAARRGTPRATVPRRSRRTRGLKVVR